MCGQDPEWCITPKGNDWPDDITDWPVGFAIYGQILLASYLVMLYVGLLYLQALVEDGEQLLTATCSYALPVYSLYTSSRFVWKYS